MPKKTAHDRQRLVTVAKLTLLSLAACCLLAGAASAEGDAIRLVRPDIADAPQNPMPEPGAALVYGVGIAVFAYVKRNRRKA